MPIPEIEITLPIERLQWRGSIDGILWSHWRDIAHPEDLLWRDEYRFCQARIFVNGEWHYSRIETWD